MPGVDGWAFLRERRVQPALTALPVVVFSAAGREGLHDASALRATAVLPKPLNLDVLAAVLEHVLSDSRDFQVDASNAALTPNDSSIEEALPASEVFPATDGSATAESAATNELATADGSQTTGRRVGTCPICGIALYADIDDCLTVPARIR